MIGLVRFLLPIVVACNAWLLTKVIAYNITDAQQAAFWSMLAGVVIGTLYGFHYRNLLGEDDDA